MSIARHHFHSRFLFALLILTLAVSGLYGADAGGTFIWKGSNLPSKTTNWFTGSNWHSSTVPGAANSVYIGDYADNPNADVLINGAPAYSSSAFIGWGSSITPAVGVVTVSGAGTVWTLKDASNVAAPVFVGYGTNGNGTLNILTGAEVVSGTGHIGSGAAGSEGLVSVDGGKWNLTGSSILNVAGGTGAKGELEIKNGGQVILSNTVFIGSYNTSEGKTTVMGLNSLLQTTANLYVGSSINDATSAVLEIKDQGKVKSRSGYVDDVGSAWVDGTNSVWQMTESMYLNGDDPVLKITNGGEVKVALSLYNYGGTIQIGDGAGAGLLNVTGDITNYGIIKFNHTDASYTFGGTILDTMQFGTAEHNGTGTTIFTGTKTYQGNTYVNAGTLLINTALPNSAEVRVANEATLGGTGTIGQAVIVAAGGRIAPGASPGTLTVGSLALASTSHLDFELGSTAGPNDLIAVTGALTLDGILNIDPQAGFGTGVYTLITYGSLTANYGLNFGSTPVGYDYTLNLTTPGQVNLLVNAGDLQYWDGSDTAGNGVVDGGMDMWNNTRQNWTSPDGSVNAAWNGKVAVFAGSPGYVTLGSNIAFEGMQFTVGSGWTPYTIGGGNALFPTGAATIRTDSGVAATISAQITGGGSLVKTGAGLLHVTNFANNYTGGTTLQQGVLSVQQLLHNLTNNHLGTGTLTVEGGTLRTWFYAPGGAPYGTQFHLPNDIAVRGDFEIDTILEHSALSGGTTDGQLVFDGDMDLGNASRVIRFSSTAVIPYMLPVQFAGSISQATGSIAGLTITNLSTTTYPDVAVAFSGSTSNSYTGLTHVYGGTTAGQGGVSLRLDKSVPNGSILGDLLIGYNGSVESYGEQIADDSTVTVNSVTAGSLSLVGFAVNQEAIGTLLGNGKVSMRGVSTTDGTYVTGYFAVGAGSFSGEIADGFAANFSQTTGGVTRYVGATEFRKVGTGTLTLSGANTYVGATRVEGGTLLVNGSLGDTPVTVTNGATLGGTGSIGNLVTIEDSGILSPGSSGPGTLSVASLFLNNSSVLDFQLGGSQDDLIHVTDPTGSLTLDGILKVTDQGSFGPGLYRLINYSTDSGFTFTDNGLVQDTMPAGHTYEIFSDIPNPDDASTESVVLLVDGSSLQFWEGSNMTPGNQLQGRGGNGVWNNTSTNWTNFIGAANTNWGGETAAFAGAAGIVTLGENVTFQGMQFITGGYLMQSGGSAEELQTSTQAIIRVDATNLPTTIAAPITGSGGITKTGPGTLALTGASTYTGDTLVDGGILQVSGSGSITSHAAILEIASSAATPGSAPELHIFNAGSVSVSEVNIGNTVGSSGLLYVHSQGVLTSAGDIYVGGNALGQQGVGTLDVRNTGEVNANMVKVWGTGRITGDGIINAPVHIADGGVISPGNSPGTLTINSTLVLSPGSTLEFELAQPGVKGGGVNDFIQVNGDLTLHGNLALITLGPEGTYHLIGHTGSLTNYGLTISATPSGVNPGNLLVDTSTTGEVNLLYAIQTETGTPIEPAFIADTQYWDGGNANANGRIDGGSGVWVAGATNWTNIQGLVNGPWAGQTAVFRGAPGTVTLGSDIPFEKLIFNVGGYQIVSPYGYQLYAPGNAEIQTDTGVTSIAEPLTVIGLFTKSGAGTLELNAPAVAHGGTQITAGGLTINSTLHSPFVNVHSGANLTVNGSVFADLYNHGTTLINPGGQFKGGMTNYGGATLHIQGTAIGNLTNAGFAHIFAGGLLVGNVSNSGHLKVNGTVDGSVRNSGLLTGAGLITGDVWNAGIVAPGNSIGTLTIGRSFTQTKSGTLQIEAASLGNHDILVVGGTAKLAGTLELLSLGYKAQFGDQIPFLVAGSIKGGFHEIDVPNPARNRGRFVNYGHVGALLFAPASYTLVAKSGNEHSLARALDQWIGIEEGDIGEVTLALDLQREDQYAQSFAAISPAYYEGALSTGIELSHNHQQLLHQQLNARRLAYRIANVPAMPVPQSTAKEAKAVTPELQPTSESDLRWSAWTQGSGLFSSGGLSLTPGESFESGTILVGADYLLTDALAIGLFGSYQEGWGDYDHGGDIDLDATRFGVYFTYDSGGFYANTALGFGQTGFDVKRPVQWTYLNRTATSEPDGWEFFTSASAGYDLKRGNWTFGPQLGLQYSKLSLDEFTETGVGTLNLRLQDTDIDSLRTYLGGRIAYTHQVSERFAIIPEVRAFWQHEFLDGGSANVRLDSGNGPVFSHQFSDPDEDSFYLGAGLGFQVGADFYLNLYYNLDLGRRDEESHTFSVSGTVRF